MLSTFHRRLFLNWPTSTLILSLCCVYFNSIPFFSFLITYSNSTFIIFSIAYPISNLRYKRHNQISINVCLACLFRQIPMTSSSKRLPTILKTKYSQTWSNTSGSFCSLESLNWINKLPLSSQASHEGLHPCLKSIILTSTSHSEGNLMEV